MEEETITQLAVQVSQLTERLDKLTYQMTKTISQLKGYRRQPRSRSPGRFNYRRRSFSQTEQNGICYYQQKVGDKSYKCQLPASERKMTSYLGRSISPTSVADQLPSRLLFLVRQKDWPPLPSRYKGRSDCHTSNCCWPEAQTRLRTTSCQGW